MIPISKHLIKVNSYSGFPQMVMHCKFFFGLLLKIVDYQKNEEKTIYKRLHYCIKLSHNKSVFSSSTCNASMHIMQFKE